MKKKNVAFECFAHVSHTDVIPVGILVPPAAPITNRTSPSLSAIIVGLIDVKALLFGAILFPGEPGNSK